MSARAWLYGGLSAFVVASWATLEQKSAGSTAPLMNGAPSPAAVSTPEPAPAPTLERKVLEPAVRDPFVAVAPPPPPAPPPAPPAPKTPEPPPPPPAPPPLNLRFSGRMLAPDGGLIVFATLGSETVVLAPGTNLSNGYRVEKVADGGVELLYPPLNARARLDIPPAPSFEIR